MVDREQSEDFRNKVAEIIRQEEADFNRLSLQPAHEVGYRAIGVGTISLCNVSTSIVTGTQTGT